MQAEQSATQQENGPVQFDGIVDSHADKPKRGDGVGPLRATGGYRR
jgi:hypothetical protein